MTSINIYIQNYNGQQDQNKIFIILYIYMTRHVTLDYNTFTISINLLLKTTTNSHSDTSKLNLWSLGSIYQLTLSNIFICEKNIEGIVYYIKNIHCTVYYYITRLHISTYY